MTSEREEVSDGMRELADWGRDEIARQESDALVEALAQQIADIMRERRNEVAKFRETLKSSGLPAWLGSEDGILLHHPSDREAAECFVGWPRLVIHAEKLVPPGSISFVLRSEMRLGNEGGAR